MCSKQKNNKVWQDKKVSWSDGRDPESPYVSVRFGGIYYLVVVSSRDLVGSNLNITWMTPIQQFDILYTIIFPMTK